MAHLPALSSFDFPTIPSAVSRASRNDPWQPRSRVTAAAPRIQNVVCFPFADWQAFEPLPVFDCRESDYSFWHTSVYGRISLGNFSGG